MALGCSESFHRSALTEVTLTEVSGVGWKAVSPQSCSTALTAFQMHTLLPVE